MKIKKNIFFGGLNELRAIAALSVILHHIELFKHRDQLGSLFDYKYTQYFIEHLGKNGVFLFFVLSGFLITYLLLSEKEKNRTVYLKKFYLRRIFRIWPLYYIIIFISFIIIPVLVFYSPLFSITPSYYRMIKDASNYDLKSFLLYFMFLPNFALKAGKVVVGATQSWSVGVEEQFYIVWPIIVSFFKRKTMLLIFLSILIVFAIINLQFSNSLIGKIVTIIPFEFMAIGALGGYFYFKKADKFTQYTKSNTLYIIVLMLIAILISVPVFKLYIQNIILGFVFLLLILITINSSNKVVLRSRSFSFLGTISYGIYMYHPLIMFLIFPVFYKLLTFYNNIFVFNIGVLMFIPGITILVSYGSYRYIEKKFINIKDSKFKTL
ncbi:acyltransferase [Chryseobacterium sp. WLY505]|uniref:acyltransferase family protein n=1 Tax=Chryseobacterium sp. WLY505 TaxID=3068892 RepID=UPI0027968384|nr:acyltransferase [Chryseobacterium sp. WLY505]MDQ1857438.1 acyltransferase [Chryseobacterium sp. WLY505]